MLKGGGGNDSFFAQDENSGLIVAYGEDGNDRFYLEGDLFIAKGGAGNDVYVVDEDWEAASGSSWTSTSRTTGSGSRSSR